MERVGDRGYKLSIEEWMRVASEEKKYYDLHDKGNIIAEVQSTNSSSEISVVVVFDGEPSMKLFESICQDVNPPIEIPPAVFVPQANR